MDPSVAQDSVCISRLISPTSSPFISPTHSQKYLPAWLEGLYLRFWSLPLLFSSCDCDFLLSSAVSFLRHPVPTSAPEITAYPGGGHWGQRLVAGICVV